MAISGSVKWNYRQYKESNAHTYYGFQTIVGSDSVPVCSNDSTYADTDNTFSTVSAVVSTAYPSGYGATISVTGSLSGGFLVPVGARVGDPVSGGCINIPGGSPQFCCTARIFSSENSPVKLSNNGLYYLDSSGNWHDVASDNIVATANEVSNLPSDVEFNGWLIDHEVIEGSDGNFYDLNGHEVFQNLPSSIDVSKTQVDGIYNGSDGNYYDINGDTILGDLPVGVEPVNKFGDVVLGSDGNYYDIDGFPVMGNLPDGVTITGYDGSSNSYVGSDGKNYDIDGNEVEDESCNGTLIDRGLTCRFSINGVDIFGSEFSYTVDVPVGTNFIALSANPDFNPLKKINRISFRNFEGSKSIGNSRVAFKALIVGFRAGVDIDGIDPDIVLGTYKICDCVFHTCDLYSDVVLNQDLPLGITPNTSSLDIGYYAMSGNLELEWSLDEQTVFPYCCPSLDDSEKDSGSTKDNQISDLNDVVEKLDDINKSLKKLVEAVNNVSFEAIIENGLYCDIRKKFYEPLPVDDNSIEDG